MLIRPKTNSRYDREEKTLLQKHLKYSGPDRCWQPTHYDRIHLTVGSLSNAGTYPTVMDTPAVLQSDVKTKWSLLETGRSAVLTATLTPYRAFVAHMAEINVALPYFNCSLLKWFNNESHLHPWYTTTWMHRIAITVRKTSVKCSVFRSI